MKQPRSFAGPEVDPASIPKTYPGLRYVIGFREAARALYECDGDIQLAEYAEPADYMNSVRLPEPVVRLKGRWPADVSQETARGAWVEAWLWVADSDVVTRDDEIGLMEAERIWPDFDCDVNDAA